MQALNSVELRAKRTQSGESVTIYTEDDVALKGRLYATSGAVQGNIVVAGATGVAQRFYRRFACYATEQGFNVMTLDYRGVAESRTGDLTGFSMSYLDWGRYDIAAAIEAMYQVDVPLYLVGHSYGGQALGLLPNHQLLAGAYSFGTGAGWTGWMSKREAIKVKFMWAFVLPLIVRWKGFMAWSLLGMGEDLPLGVYRDWKRWCQYPNYFFDDPDYSDLIEAFSKVSIPYIAATSTDDLWAPPESRDAFCRYFSSCDLTLTTLEATPELPIGHMGYFRAGSEHLWHQMLSWFSQLDQIK